MKSNLKLLFQGDSITDGNRDRGQDPNHIYGHGYVFLIASQLGSQFAEQRPLFYNRGVSGHRVSDLYARWNEDAISLQPDLISILAGVNDAWHIVNQTAGGASNRFERTYTQLLRETKEVLPQTKLILCEPFILKTAATEPVYEIWHELITQYQEQVRQLCIDFDATFVPLQDVFDEAAKRTTAEQWVWDGIHPTAAGHYLLAKRWLEVVEKQGLLD